MNFVSFEENKTDKPLIMLIPGLGVSYEIFLPLINLLKNRYRIVAVQIDLFLGNTHLSLLLMIKLLKLLIMSKNLTMVV